MIGIFLLWCLFLLSVMGAAWGLFCLIEQFTEIDND